LEEASRALANNATVLAESLDHKDKKQEKQIIDQRTDTKPLVYYKLDKGLLSSACERSKYNIKDLLNEKYQELYESIDRNKVPEYVIIGAPYCGKSELLHRLTGFPLCTPELTAVSGIQRRSCNVPLRVSIRFLEEDELNRLAVASLKVKSTGAVLTSMEIEPEAGEIIKAVDNLMGEAERKWKAEGGQTSVILDMEVVVMLWQHGSGNFDIIELPGLVLRPDKERKGREAVANSYVEGDRSNRYFICVVSAGTFLHNDQVLPFMEGHSNGSQVCESEAVEESRHVLLVMR
jgi:hypothetical protein